jgi:hypothetical protein
MNITSRRLLGGRTFVAKKFNLGAINGKRKWTKGQTTTYKTLCIKLKSNMTGATK